MAAPSPSRTTRSDATKIEVLMSAAYMSRGGVVSDADFVSPRHLQSAIGPKAPSQDTAQPSCTWLTKPPQQFLAK